MNPIINLLSDKSVIDIELSDSKTELTITEGCDSYYSVSLSKDEVSKLIEELTNLKEQMIWKNT
jgi:hypothetical protein